MKCSLTHTKLNKYCTNLLCSLHIKFWFDITYTMCDLYPVVPRCYESQSVSKRFLKASRGLRAGRMTRSGRSAVFRLLLILLNHIPFSIIDYFKFIERFRIIYRSKSMHQKNNFPPQHLWTTAMLLAVFVEPLVLCWSVRAVS